MYPKFVMSVSVRNSQGWPSLRIACTYLKSWSMSPNIRDCVTGIMKFKAEKSVGEQRVIVLHVRSTSLFFWNVVIPSQNQTFQLDTTGNQPGEFGGKNLAWILSTESPLCCSFSEIAILEKKAGNLRENFQNSGHDLIGFVKLDILLPDNHHRGMIARFCTQTPWFYINR